MILFRLCPDTNKGFLLFLPALIALALSSTEPICAQKGTTVITELNQIEALRTTNPLLAWHLTDSLQAVEKAANFKNTPQYRFDFLFGRIASSMNRNNQAVDFFLKAFESDSVQAQNSQYIRTAYLLCEELLIMQDNERAMKYILLALEKSRSVHDFYNESVCLGILSKVYYFNDQMDKAYETIEQAISIMEENRNNTNVFSLDKLAIYRSVQADYYGYANEHEKSIESVKKGLEMLENLPSEKPAGGAIDKVNFHYWVASFYAMLASQYQMIGKDELAKQNANKAISLIKDYKILRIDVYYKVLYYLTNAQQFTEAIQLTNYLKTNQTETDTINIFSQAYSNFLAQSYQGKGDYRNAYKYLLQNSEITNALNTRARAEASMALATVYETSKKDAQILANEFKLKNKNRLIILLVAGILFLAAISFLVWRNSRIVKTKNRGLYARLKEQDKLYAELKRLKQEAIHKPTPENTDTENKSLFDRLEDYLYQTQRYTEPSLSRDILALEMGTNYKYLCDAIQETKGVTFNDYLNTLRLDHARNLLYDLKTNPVIEDVLLSSGFTNKSTFYRLFRQKFGLTPTELKELVKEERRSLKAN